MCTKTYDPNRAETMESRLARLGTSAATPLDRAVLAVLTDRARAAGDSTHPDDVIAGATRYAQSVPLEPHTPGCGCQSCTTVPEQLDALTDAAAAPRATRPMMRLNAAGTGLESFDAPVCDWCDQTAAVQVDTAGEPSHPDLACDFHLGYWFAAPIAAGEAVTVTRLDHRHPRG